MPKVNPFRPANRQDQHRDGTVPMQRDSRQEVEQKRSELERAARKPQKGAGSRKDDAQDEE